MIRSITCSLAIILLLGSCGALGISKPEKKEEPSPYGASGIPPQLRVKDGDSGTAVTAGGNIPANAMESLFTPQEDIVYTDPDNPEATIPELATLLSAPKRGPWEESETIARQLSVREGKPLLIWFTDSQSSPMCKALSQELFATNDFGSWAMENLVRLQVDDYVKITDPNMSIDDATDRQLRIRDYNAKLKKRYKVLGYPSLIVVSPGGEVVGRYRGYKRGEAQLMWGKLKHAKAVSDNVYEGWRKGMEKKGYRDWEDGKGRKIFAKLISYSKGELILIEPNGTRARTKESVLSQKDRDWIAEQKKLRNID